MLYYLNETASPNLVGAINEYFTVFVCTRLFEYETHRFLKRNISYFLKFDKIHIHMKYFLSILLQMWQVLYIAKSGLS